MGLNPFEVREVLQVYTTSMQIRVIRLNPFEVREVLQGFNAEIRTRRNGLNPFEVREVLQASRIGFTQFNWVSIPLKSGRCCKVSVDDPATGKSLNPFEVREVLQAHRGITSILKVGLNPFEVREVLQDLKT